MIEPVKLVFAHRSLLFRAVKDVIRQRNAGSILGSAWLVLSPLVFLGAYTVIYLFVFRLRPTGMTATHYILHIFSGLVPFLFMSEAIGAGMGSIDANKNLLRNTVFPASLLPVRAVLASMPTYLFSMAILIVWSLVESPSWAMLAVFPIMVMQVAFVVGVSWVLSLLVLLVRDIRNVYSHCILLLMIASPIAYTPDMIPAKLRPLLWLNPFGYFVIGTQTCLAHGSLPPADLATLLVASTVVLFLGGHAFFESFKKAVGNYA